MNKFKRFAKTVLNGLVRMVCGTAIALVYTAAVYGFVSIPKDSGYVAVVDFLASVATLAVAVGCTYAFGRNKSPE